jgi:hypothetical protein
MDLNDLKNQVYDFQDHALNREELIDMVYDYLSVIDIEWEDRANSINWPLSYEEIHTANLVIKRQLYNTAMASMCLRNAYRALDVWEWHLKEECATDEDTNMLFAYLEQFHDWMKV